MQRHKGASNCAGRACRVWQEDRVWQKAGQEERPSWEPEAA